MIKLLIFPSYITAIYYCIQKVKSHKFLGFIGYVCKFLFYNTQKKKININFVFVYALRIGNIMDTKKDKKIVLQPLVEPTVEFNLTDSDCMPSKQIPL